MYSYFNVFLPEDPVELCKYIGDENIFKLVFKDVSYVKKYVSPLRDTDSRPGCFFWETPDSRVYFIDYGNPGKTHFTSIEFIKEYFKFETIHETLNFIKKKFISHINTDYKIEEEVQDKTPKIEKKIEVYSRDWNLQDRDYWTQYGITKKQLEDDLVIPVKYYRIIYPDQNFKTIVPFSQTYAYKLDNNQIKIYTPLDKVFKWYTNASNNTIGNINNITGNGKRLIITKSYKDCRVLQNLGYDEVVWFQSEGQIPKVEILLELVNDYEEVIIFYDNDITGINQGNKLKDFLNSLTGSDKFKFVHLPVNFKQKDPSDFYKEFGEKQSKSLIKKIIKNVTKKN